MNLREIENTTDVYFRDYDVYPIKWEVSGDSSELDAARKSNLCIERHETDGTVWYGIPRGEESTEAIGHLTRTHRESRSYLTQADLPTEFFNHELMNVNVNDGEDVFSFVRTWGLPFLPDRNKGVHDMLLRASMEPYGFLWHTHVSKAIKQTEDMRKRWCDLGEEREEQLYETVISHKEAAICIATLQHVVKGIQDAIRGNHKLQDGAAFMLNSVCCRDSLIGNGRTADIEDNGNLKDRGLLTSAICNQIIEALEDADTPWRECAYEECSKLFKYQHGKSDRPHKDSIYCCRKHMETQKKRNQRAAAKNRIQH